MPVAKHSRQDIRDFFAKALATGRWDDKEDLMDYDFGHYDISREVKTEYVPSALAQEFHQAVDHTFVRALMSCFGAGTTTAAIMDFVFSYPIRLCGPRAKTEGRDRVLVSGAIVRRTFRDIRRSIVPVFVNMMPANVEWEWKASLNQFIVTYRKNDMDFTIQLEGLGLDRPTAQTDLQGLPVSYVIVSEPMGVKDKIIETACARAGRGGWLTPGKVVIEGNPPPRNRDFWSLFGGAVSSEVEGTAQPRKFGLKDQSELGYKQVMHDSVTGENNICFWYPAADSDYAFFAAYLPDGKNYYLRQRNYSLQFRKPNLYGMMGGNSEGDRVFEFDERANVRSDRHTYSAKDKIVLAADADRWGACIFAVIRPDGGLFITDSVTAKDWGADAFGFEIAKKLLEMKNVRVAYATIDPTANRRANTSDDMYSEKLSEAVTKYSGTLVRFEPQEYHWNNLRLSVSTANAMLKNTPPAHGATDPIITVHSGCVDVINALNNYCYKDSDADRERLDKSDKTMSALGDSVRYLCSFWFKDNPAADAEWEKWRNDPRYGEMGAVAFEFGDGSFNPLAA